MDGFWQRFSSIQLAVALDNRPTHAFRNYLLLHFLIEIADNKNASNLILSPWNGVVVERHIHKFLLMAIINAINTLSACSI